MLENLAVFYHGSIYKTRPLERMLKMMFQEQPLFGGTNSQLGMPPKVVVTATTSLEQRSVVFANYNRQDQAEQSKHPSRSVNKYDNLTGTSRHTLPILAI